MTTERMPDFEVRPGLWDVGAKVAKVMRRRHSVIFPGYDEPTKVSFCNDCGGAFVIGDKCASCGGAMDFPELPKPAND
jgi:hypothetical protein